MKKYLPEIANVFRFKPSDVDEQLSTGGAELTTAMSTDLRDILAYRKSILEMRG